MNFRHQLACFALLGGILLCWTTRSPELLAHPHAIAEESPSTVHQSSPISLLPEKASAPILPSPSVSAKASQIGRLVSYTPPPLVNLKALKLPETETGGVMLFPVDNGDSQGHLEIQEDLRDPLTTVGSCTRWIVSCVEPGTRSLDDCARSAPHCATDKPWEEEAHCCPASCFESYATLRVGGVEPIPAFDAVYFESGSCFPGLEDLLNGVALAPPPPVKQPNKEYSDVY